MVKIIKSDADLGGVVKFNDVSTLVKDVRENHTKANELKLEGEKKKQELREVSTKVFFNDVSKPTVPDLRSSHEYQTSAGIVRVSFKVAARPLTQINDRPAGETLTEIFKEHTDKLFDTSSEHTVTADDATLLKQAQDHPELFGIGLKALTHQEVMVLIANHPEMVAVAVRDPDGYAKIYPNYVKTETTMSVKNGFIEAVDKLEGSIKQAARGFLEIFLKPFLEPAVVIGNNADKAVASTKKAKKA